MMDPIMLVYKMNDKVVTMAIEHNGTLASIVSMCREFGYPYEVYAYSDEYGYQRTVRWPAQI